MHHNARLYIKVQKISTRVYHLLNLFSIINVYLTKKVVNKILFENYLEFMK